MLCIVGNRKKPDVVRKDCKFDTLLRPVANRITNDHHTNVFRWQAAPSNRTGG